MAFNWQRFLEANHIHFVTSGANVSRGHIAIHCPLCGSADPSQHMSLNLDGGGWKCWRNQDHSGKSATFLVQKLLNITREQAQAIVGDGVFVPENFLETVMAKVNPVSIGNAPGLKMPKEFRRLDPDKASARHFVNYLCSEARGFTLNQVRTMCDEYGLRYCTEGKFRGRIIFPVWYEGKLVTWTGRTIYQSDELRYKSLATKSDDPKATLAVGPITDYLLWYDQLLENAEGNRTLVACEGPFDSLKVSVLGRPYGIDSTCFTTSTPSGRQIQLLAELADRYPNRFLLLDRGTLGNAIRTASAVRALRFKVLTLPPAIKDPGLLTRSTLLKIIPH